MCILDNITKHYLVAELQIGIGHGVDVVVHCVDVMCVAVQRFDGLRPSRLLILCSFLWHLQIRYFLVKIMLSSNKKVVKKKKETPQSVI